MNSIENLKGSGPRSSEVLKSNEPLAVRAAQNHTSSFDNDLKLSERPNISTQQITHQVLEVDMDFAEDEDEEEMADKEDEEDQEKMGNAAENMDILSELQMKQQEIAMKKDGLLSTE